MDNYNYLCDKISEILNDKKVSNLKKDYKNISSKYRSERADSTIMVSTSDEVVSYLSTRMAETATIVDCVLSRVDKMCSFSKDVESVLDLGSGTGSCLWALDNYINNKKIVAIERENEMINISERLSRNLSNEIEYIHQNILAKDVNTLPEFDLVIEAFMLNEMKDAERKLAVELMCDKSNDFVIMIEPGTPLSHQRMMDIRRQVLARGFKLILPCPHEGDCGLCDDYCNFSTRVLRTKISKLVKGGSLNYEDEKFFYLVFRKNNDMSPKFNSTIIRRPIYRKGCVDLKVCKVDGSIATKTITKSNRENYKVAKELKHGDVCKF